MSIRSTPSRCCRFRRRAFRSSSVRSASGARSRPGVEAVAAEATIDDAGEEPVNEVEVTNEVTDPTDEWEAPAADAVEGSDEREHEDQPDAVVEAVEPEENVAGAVTSEDDADASVPFYKRELSFRRKKAEVEAVDQPELVAQADETVEVEELVDAPAEVEPEVVAEVAADRSSRPLLASRRSPRPTQPTRSPPRSRRSTRPRQSRLQPCTTPGGRHSRRGSARSRHRRRAGGRRRRSDRLRDQRRHHRSRVAHGRRHARAYPRSSPRSSTTVLPSRSRGCRRRGASARSRRSRGCDRRGRRPRYA